MSTLIAVIALIVAGTPIATGRASQYAPGVMERVVALRQDWGQLPDDVSAYDGFIAVQD